MDKLEEQARRSLMGEDEPQPPEPAPRRPRLRSRGRPRDLLAEDAPRRRRIPLAVRLGVAGLATVALLNMIDLPRIVGALTGGGGAELEAMSAVPAIPAASGADGAGPGSPSAGAVLRGTDAVWEAVFSELGVGYDKPRLAPAHALADSACAGQGAATPHYCPADGRLYADAAVAAPPAHAFGLAHEVGRHIQAMLGTLAATSAPGSVLQADCYAGVWAARGGAGAETLTPASLPETAGIAAPPRRTAFARGYETRDLLACQELGSAL
jgi:predicted metalloprotease